MLIDIHMLFHMTCIFNILCVFFSYADMYNFMCNLEVVARSKKIAYLQVPLSTQSTAVSFPDTGK